MDLNKPDFSFCEDIRYIRWWDAKIIRVLSTGANTKEYKHLSGGAGSWLQSIKMKYRNLHSWGTLFRELTFSRGKYWRSLEKVVKEVKPDVAYVMVSTRWMAKNVYRICKRQNIPLCVHIVDDFVPNLYSKVPFRTLIQSSAYRWIEKIVDFSTARAAIGPHMAAEYSKRYGKPWDWFTTLVDAASYNPHPRKPENDLIKLTYAGNLDEGRFASLCMIVAALKKISIQDVKTKLAIYTHPQHYRIYKNRFGDSKGVELNEWVPPDQLPGLFHDSDILIHCEALHPTEEAMSGIRWSLSTKISQCMMAGRCILAIGHKDLAAIRFIQEQRVGIVITTDDTEEIAKRLLEVAGDRHAVDKIGMRGRERALKLFEGTKQRERFRQFVWKAIDSDRESN